MLRFHRFALATTFVLASGAIAAACASHDTPEAVGKSEQALAGDGLVISQVFGGSASTGSPYNQDYVEIFNATALPISLTGLSVQYGSATGNFGASASAAVALTGTIPAGGYYLVGFATGGTGVALPTPDKTGAADLSGTNGKVVLVRGTDPLACGATATACSSTQTATFVDLVAYGTGLPAEGTAVGALSATTAATRKGAGCTDTNDNSADFEKPAPAPRNSATPIHLCAVDGGVDAGDADVATDTALDVALDGADATDTGSPLDGGSDATDTGSPLDGGADATDTGSPVDGGADATDTGSPVDGGADATDSGTSSDAADGGGDTADGGTTTDSAADTAVDSGTAVDSATDSGTAADSASTDSVSTADTGTVDSAAADTAVADTGSTVDSAVDSAIDSATDSAVADSAISDSATDTGTEPEDTGTEPEDTGTADDTGTAEVDSGSADTGPDVAPPVAAEDDGCGCSVVGADGSRTTGATLAGLALGLAVLARRRRR